MYSDNQYGDYSLARKSLVLGEDWKDILRTYEQREAQHHESLDRDRFAYDQYAARKLRQIDLIDQIESNHIAGLRQTRSDLDLEIMASHEVASKAFATLGLGYEPGKTKIEDLYSLTPLHESDAAKLAGLSGVPARKAPSMRFLKVAGMIGCLVLGTVGMGSLILQTPPKMLFTSPLFLLISMALAFILIGGATMVVVPLWKRIGIQKVASDIEKRPCLSLVSGLALTILMAVVVAVVDAKAMMAINASRALINPESVPGFLLCFLVGLALSAAYIIGSSVVAFSDAYSAEAASRIKAEQERHESEQLHDRRIHIEVQMACEALNTVALIENRRVALTNEIEVLEEEFKNAIAGQFAQIPLAPEMKEENRKDLRMQKKEARFAGWKAMAHDLAMSRTRIAGRSEE